MERKKRSKGRGLVSWYVKTIYGMFGVEMRAYGQKLVKLCTQTHRGVSFSSIDEMIGDPSIDGLECLLNPSTSAIARVACQGTVAHGCGFLWVNSIASIVFTRNGR